MADGAYAPIDAVIGEWVGASKGLGYLMFASLIMLACLTVLLHVTVGLLATRLTNYAQDISSKQKELL